MEQLCDTSHLHQTCNTNHKERIHEERNSDNSQKLEYKELTYTEVVCSNITK